MIEEMKQDQSTEIEDIAEEITGTLAEAFDILIARREAALATAIAPLDAEIESLTREHGAIEEAAHNLELLLPAKARIAQNEADQLTVAGKSEEAKAKLEEMRQAESAPGAMRARQSEIADRVEEIEGEKRDMARRIFRPWFTELLPVVRAAEHGLFITLLDGLEESCRQYEVQTGASMIDVLGHTFASLTADEHSREWGSGQRWYQGRTRR
jgi:hypothetical protein